MLTQARPAQKIRIREITEEDHGPMAQYLAKSLGYPAWAYFKIFKILKDHDTPAGFPKFGYALEAEGKIAGGIILVFSSARGADQAPAVRCHVTAWCVDPAYRSFATMFAQKALRHKDVTYLNLSARPNAVPIIEAQGFEPFASGRFFAVPLLASKSEGKAVAAALAPADRCDPYERKLVLAHDAYGCIAFWCLTAEHAYPFVFQRRFIKHVIPAAQLIYCRDLSDVSRFAAPIGAYLASRGRLVAIVDANEALAGLPGRYFAGARRWYRGPRPRLGDLAYTLPAMFPPAKV